jgi:preprotein translocase subunit SecG
METVLLVLHVIVAISLIGLVLIQRSESDGFGMGSGSGMNFMTGRATANLLTRATAILATIFIINSLALSIIASRRDSTSLLGVIQEQEASKKTPAVPVNADAKTANKKDAPDAAAAEKTAKDTDKKAPADKKSVDKKPAAPAVPEAK